MVKLIILCQFNGGCMGCCGHGFISKEKIKEAVKRNTIEFSNSNDLIKFRDRAYSRDLRFGVCRNLIEKEGVLFCPLHPQQNSGKDLREGHCDTEYLCKTAQEFSKWGEEKQKDFLELVEKKRLDNLDYSLRIDNGTLLKEFEFFK